MQVTTEQLRKAYSDIEFNEEQHIYTLNGERLPSVTHTLKQFYKPFDTKIADYVAKRQGRTGDEVRAEWKEKGRVAIELGNRVHNYAEDLGAYYKGFLKDLRAPQDYKELAVYQWFSQLDSDRYHLLATELQVYNEHLSYAGTADALFWDDGLKGIVIVDWKTNFDLFKQYGKQKMLGPFKHLEDHKFNHYQLQLSLYQLALESKGFPVVGRKIVWAGNAPNTFECFVEHETEFYGNELKEHLSVLEMNDAYF